MPSLIGLLRKINGTEDLKSVVKTMKALAAVNIRQFEKAVDALRTYSRTVEMGLQVVLRHRPGFSVTARTTAAAGATGAVVYGTDQGMCGALNETIVTHALNVVDGLNIAHERLRLIAVGNRALNRLEDESRQVQRTFSVPGSVGAVTPLVQALLVEIEQWLDRDDVAHVFLFNCRPQSGAAYRPHYLRLLPLDRQWLRELREKRWPGNQLPLFTMDWEALFSALIHQYVFISLYRAAVESLAAENASRLAAMQGAESNIEDRLDELQGRYHRQRQMGITEELLDVVSGFEALRESAAGRKR
jgi:F-type H+-transporting ATPase subunit gamma